MPPKGQKKAFDNGVLCGLRSDTPTVPPKSPRPSLTRDNIQGADQPVAPVIPSPRPQSLTLPFQNRDRASHLISDEEFDRIMKQSELDNPVPRLPSGIPSHLSGLGIRRAASTTKGSRTSLFAQRPRPASANFSNAVHAAAHDAFPRPAFSRDPTLTALPRPPTKNDMAIYPSQSNINPFTTTSGINDTLSDSVAPTPTSRSQTPALQALSGQKGSEQGNRRGHKRQFSLSLAAANMVESVKKRIKRPESPDPSSMRISSPMNISTQTDRDSRSNIPYTFPSHPTVHPIHDPNFMTQVSTNSDATFTTAADVNTDVDPNAPATPTPTSTKKQKSTLQRTWSLTKDTARETRTLITPITRLINRPKEPTFVEVFPNSSRRTTSSNIGFNNPTSPQTSSTTNTSAYFASTESSPFLTSSGHFYANNSNVAAARPKPWLTAPRES